MGIQPRAGSALAETGEKQEPQQFIKEQNAHKYPDQRLGSANAGCNHGSLKPASLPTKSHPNPNHHSDIHTRANTNLHSNTAALQSGRQIVL